MKKNLFLFVLGIALLVSLWPEFLGATAAPKVITLTATDIQATSATLKGTVDPGGLRTDFYFISCDATSTATFFLQTVTQTVEGTGVKAVSQTMTGLKPNSTYRYAITAMNSLGKVNGSCFSFTTKSATTLPPAGSAPVVATLPATEVTSTTATLNATVNPKGVATKANFKSCAASSTDPAYFAPTSAKDLAAATTPQTVGYRLSGLKPGLTYKYAIQASSAGGNTVGDCVSFTTAGQAATRKPTVRTMPASDVGTKNATLNGQVNPNGLATTYSFVSESTGPSDPMYFPATDKSEAGSGSLSLNVTANISGLFPNVMYKYRIRSKNSAGESYGEYVSFTTARASGPPSVHTEPATAVLGTSAILNGLFSANGGTGITYQFISCDNANAPGYFPPTAPRSPETTTRTITVWAEIKDLKPETRYRYALKASGNQGASTGDCVMFTTLAAQAAVPTVSGLPATGITQLQANLEGYVNPNGLVTSVWFTAGVAGPSEPGYFPDTPKLAAGSGTERKKMQYTLTGLFPGQTYKYQIAAENSLGRSYGPSYAFATKDQSGIIVQTQPAQGVTSNSALLVAKADPGGASGVSIHFVSEGNYSFPATSAQSLYPYYGMQTVTKIVNYLQSGLRYGFRAVATTADGKETKGSTLYFTTLHSGTTGPPIAVTEAAQNVYQTTAELRGIVNSNGLETTYYFEACVWNPSLTPAFPPTIPKSAGAKGPGTLLTDNMTVFGHIEGLKPNTSYEYRIVAKNNKGTTRGECVTFKTPAHPPSPSSGGETRGDGKNPDRRE